MNTGYKFSYVFPKILYKYRDWENKHHKDLLYKSEIYFPAFSQFNDPFDGKLPFRYNPEKLTHDNIFLKYRKMIMEENPSWTEIQVQNACYKTQQKGLLFDDKHLKKHHEDLIKSLDSTFGIFSLTKDNNNFLMWSYYANGHNGFCIGFDGKKLFEQIDGGISKVTYQSEQPYMEFDDDVQENFLKLIYVKGKMWEHENEYRIHKSYKARQTLILTPDTISEIILGCEISQKDKFNLAEFALKKYPSASVYETQRHDTKFELILQKIL